MIPQYTFKISNQEGNKTAHYKHLLVHIATENTDTWDYNTNKQGIISFAVPFYVYETRVRDFQSFYLDKMKFKSLHSFLKDP